MSRGAKYIYLTGLLIACWVIASRYEVDFRILHDTVSLIRSGELNLIYGADGVNRSMGRYFYPPFSLVSFGWLGFIPFVAAKWIWISLQTLWFFLFWRCLSRLFPFLKERALTWGILLIGVMAIDGIHNNFQSNNIQLLLISWLLAAEVLSRSSSRNAQFMSGLLIAAASGIKVYPLFIAAHALCTKPKWVRAGVVVGTGVTLLLPFVVFGFSSGLMLYENFYKNVTSYGSSNSFLTTEDICCLPSLIARLTVGAGYTEHFAGTITKALTLLISVSFFLSVWRNPFRENSRLPTYNHSWTLAFALSVFLNPSTRPHYYIFYVPAFCALIEMSRRDFPGWGLRLATLVSAGLIALTSQGVVGKTLNDQLEKASIPTYGMILLLITLSLALALRRRKWLAPRIA